MKFFHFKFDQFFDLISIIEISSKTCWKLVNSKRYHPNEFNKFSTKFRPKAFFVKFEVNIFVKFLYQNLRLIFFSKFEINIMFKIWVQNSMSEILFKIWVKFLVNCFSRNSEKKIHKIFVSFFFEISRRFKKKLVRIFGQTILYVKT